MAEHAAAFSGVAPLLVVEHVPWEVPQRIGDAFQGVPLEVRRPLDAGELLPAPELLCGAVIMGGPMGLHDHLPGLAAEIGWIDRALERSLPILAVCLGAQLLAAALGASVAANGGWELGWGRVDVVDRHDPVIGPLAPAAEVLHWHRDRCDLPAGASLLASSRDSPCQAFRAGSAWGIQFHPEVDRDLVARWLRVPAMAAQAAAVLGDRAAPALLGGAATFDAGAAVDIARGLGAFADICRARQREVAA